MYKTPAQAEQLAAGVRQALAENTPDAEVVLCPPFVDLASVRKAVAGSEIKLGAQNLYPEEEGAFTGEISPSMLEELGVAYIIVGHSERRRYFQESDEFINRKVLAALKHRLRPILCVGETLAEREADQTEQRIETQLSGGLKDVPDPSGLVIAYEPVWAIGTGKNATPEQAQAVHLFIRQWLAQKFGGRPAEEIRIQYGGSVKPDNVRTLMTRPDIDGALVGGASLSVESFAAIVRG